MRPVTCLQIMLESGPDPHHQEGRKHDDADEIADQPVGQDFWPLCLWYETYMGQPKRAGRRGQRARCQGGKDEQGNVSRPGEIQRIVL